MKTVRAKRSGNGFTLVELLVVITIIGMLMSLLLPAVQQAREAGRRTQCANNQKNLALALISYESSHGKFPGYVNEVGPPSGSEYGKRASWAVMIFPFVEQGQLWERLSTTTTEPIAEPTLNVFRCPSGGTPAYEGPPNFFVVNAGVVHNGSSSPHYDQSPANGVFHNHFPLDLIRMGRDPKMPTRSTIDTVAIDGTGNTLMFSENIQVPSWSFVTKNGLSTVTEKQLVGFCWYSNPDPSVHGVNQDKSGYNLPDDNPLNADDYARPSSFHPGGVNTAFCDGRIHFIRDSIEYYVYQQLMTPKSTQQNTPIDPRNGLPYLLDDSEY